MAGYKGQVPVVNARHTAVEFSHPLVDKKRGRLRIGVNPNSIEWAYGLNTANYATYGGEVVQILSCFIDDMVVTGNTRDYKSLEAIYGWFVEYIQIATAGARGKGSYNQTPVTFKYPERGWTFQIYPTGLPSFKFGRDIVVPEYTIKASVFEADAAELRDRITNDKINQFIKDEGIELFGTATGNIGFNADNPFSDPDAEQDQETDPEKKKAQTKKEKADEKKDKPRDHYGELGDFFNELIPSYLKSDFKDLSANYSKPAFLSDKENKDTGKENAKKIADRQGK